MKEISSRAIPEDWIYISDSNNRFALGQPGKYNMLVVGVNPSTATPWKDDPTIRKVRNIIKESNYDGWVMVNLYPQVTSEPDNLPKVMDADITEKNMQIISEIIEKNYIAAAWAAWGNLIDKRPYLGEILCQLEEYVQCEWYYRGSLTRSGNPRHPLYLPVNGKFNWFPVYDYACRWR